MSLYLMLILNYWATAATSHDVTTVGTLDEICKLALKVNSRWLNYWMGSDILEIIVSLLGSRSNENEVTKKRQRKDASCECCAWRTVAGVFAILTDCGKHTDFGASSHKVEVPHWVSGVPGVSPDKHICDSEFLGPASCLKIDFLFPVPLVPIVWPLAVRRCYFKGPHRAVKIDGLRNIGALIQLKSNNNIGLIVVTLFRVKLDFEIFLSVYRYSLLPFLSIELNLRCNPIEVTILFAEL